MRMYSVSEAAGELGVSRTLVYALCQRRKIRHERHGLGKGKIVIPADALEDYRRSVTATPAERAAAPPSLPVPRLKHLSLD